MEVSVPLARAAMLLLASSRSSCCLFDELNDAESLR